MARFYTDVLCRSQQYTSTNRVCSLQLLEPGTRSRVCAIIADARAEGVSVVAFETYRSRERQAELFKRGATQLRDVGTHHYGLACDIVRVVDGQATWEGDYGFLGRLARVHGLIWGGDWGQPHLRHTFIDAAHVQRCNVAHQEMLFAGAWYPDERYDPYDDSLPCLA